MRTIIYSCNSSRKHCMLIFKHFLFFWRWLFTPPPPLPMNECHFCVHVFIYTHSYQNSFLRHRSCAPTLWSWTILTVLPFRSWLVYICTKFHSNRPKNIEILEGAQCAPPPPPPPPPIGPGRPQNSLGFIGLTNLNWLIIRIHFSVIGHPR